MVSQIQDIDEYYHVDDDDDLYAIFYAPDYYTTDEQLVLIAVLMLLEQRFRLMQSMSPSRVLDELEEIMQSLEYDLKDTASSKVTAHVQEYLDNVLMDYAIPLGYIDIDTSMIEIMEDSITGLINNLRDELIVKSKFFDSNLSKDDFNILPNFKRAVKKLVDAVGNNLLYSKEKSLRNVEKFVYGEDTLYKWITAGDDKVCEWCRIQEKMPPRTLDELPLDHPHGRCEKEPIDPSYTSEYSLILARRQYNEQDFEIFSENKWEY